VAAVMADHSAERQQKEQGEKQEMPAAYQEHHRGKRQPVDSEAHQAT
jgi:hypothetical protein